MIILDSTLKSLEVLLAAVPSNELPFVVTYVDVDQSTFAATAASENDGLSTNTTAATMVAAPGAGTSRQVKFLSVHNPTNNIATATVTVQLNNNGTKRIIWKGVLSIGDTLQYVG